MRRLFAQTRETCEKRGTGEAVKEGLGSELETDGKNGTGESSRFSELPTQNFELRIAPVVHVLLASLAIPDRRMKTE